MALNHDRIPSETDRQTVRALFSVSPLMERGQPVITELLWVLGGCKDAAPHAKILPEYCYHILDALRRTYFKGFPAFSDTVLVTDPARLAAAQNVAEAKKSVRLDWEKLGRLFGIAGRCFRLAD